MNLRDMKCRHCGYTAEVLLVLAMMEEAGAKASTSAGECPWSKTGKHEFHSLSTTPRNEE